MLISKSDFRGIHNLFFFLFSIHVLPPILCLLKALFNEIPKCVPEVSQFNGNCGPYSFKKYLFGIQDIPANAPRLPFCPHDLLCWLKKPLWWDCGKGWGNLFSEWYLSRSSCNPICFSEVDTLSRCEILINTRCSKYRWGLGVPIQIGKKIGGFESTAHLRKKTTLWAWAGFFKAGLLRIFNSNMKNLKSVFSFILFVC